MILGHQLVQAQYHHLKHFYSLPIMLCMSQNELEKTRKRMNRGREKIRQRCLAEEKAQREAEQAALKAAEEEVREIHALFGYTIPDMFGTECPD